MSKINVKVMCACGEEPTTREKLLTEIAMRIAYVLPYHYCEDDETMGWFAEDEEDLVRAARSVIELMEKYEA
jgi:hypothetical protein